jgi:hypothetical protein
MSFDDLPSSFPYSPLLWALMAPEDKLPCKEWEGTITRGGYGQTDVRDSTAKKGWRAKRVHRLEWETKVGPIPDGMLVCHHCDNPPCYEITHLFIGTVDDNNQDAIAKGRTRHDNNTSGTTHYRSKLTIEQVQYIRDNCILGKGSSRGNVRQLAEELGVTMIVVRRIANGMYYKKD